MSRRGAGFAVMAAMAMATVGFGPIVPCESGRYPPPPVPLGQKFTPGHKHRN